MMAKKKRKDNDLQNTMQQTKGWEKQGVNSFAPDEYCCTSGTYCVVTVKHPVASREWG
jgi:hypothetical protein